MVKLPNRKKDGQNPQAYAFDPEAKGEKTTEQLLEEAKAGNSYNSIDKVVETFGEELKTSLKFYDFRGVRFVDIFEALANPYFISGIVTHLSLYYKSSDLIVSPESRGFVFGPMLAAVNGASFVPFRKVGKLPNDNNNPLLRIMTKSEYDNSELECSLSHLNAVKVNMKKMEALKSEFKQVLEEPVDRSMTGAECKKIVEETTASLDGSNQCNDCEFNGDCSDSKLSDSKSSDIDISSVKPITVVCDDVLATGGTAVAMVNLLREQGFIVKQALFVAELESLNGRAALEAIGVEVKSIVRL